MSVPKKAIMKPTHVCKWCKKRMFPRQNVDPKGCMGQSPHTLIPISQTQFVSFGDSLDPKLVSAADTTSTNGHDDHYNDGESNMPKVTGRVLEEAEDDGMSFPWTVGQPKYTVKIISGQDLPVSNLHIKLKLGGHPVLKSQVQKGSREPEFGDIFTFDDWAHDEHLVLSVWRDEKLSRNEPVAFAEIPFPRWPPHGVVNKRFQLKKGPGGHSAGSLHIKMISHPINTTHVFAQQSSDAKVVHKPQPRRQRSRPETVRSVLSWCRLIFSSLGALMLAIVAAMLLFGMVKGEWHPSALVRSYITKNTCDVDGVTTVNPSEPECDDPGSCTLNSSIFHLFYSRW